MDQRTSPGLADVIERHAAGHTPAVLVANQRHYGGFDDVWSVDVIEYEALGLTDTHAQFYTKYEDADGFAIDLALLLGVSIERVL